MMLFLCFLASVFCTWGVVRFAPQLRLVALPSGRSSHVLPTAKGGGIGLLLVFLLVSVTDTPSYFWLPGVALSLISLVNDISDIRPRIRLSVHFLAVGILLIGFAKSDFWAFNLSPFLLLPVFLFFIVATTNFYNFMDGIDGIAGLMGMVSFSLLGVYQQFNGSPFSCVCFAMVAACAGFLVFNFPRARIFMGDVGSILLGYVFAAIAVLSATDLLDLLVMSSFLLLFYLDELFTMILRLRKKKSLMEPHRTHLYQVLANEGGVAHWKVAVVYAVLQGIIGVLILYSLDSGFVCFGGVFLGVLCCFSGCNFYIRHKFVSP